MKFRQRITLYLSLYMVMCSAVWGQVVEIPDPNLRAAVIEALDGAAPTKDNMLTLIELAVQRRDVVDLTGIEYARNLKKLHLRGNPNIDLTTLPALTSLTYLDITACNVSDLMPVSGLFNLIGLGADRNFIRDIRPLAHLTQLKLLHLNDNRITDISPLKALTDLEYLDIEWNEIRDHSPLDGLTLSTLIRDDDEPCRAPPIPLEPRLTNRTYPSIFARWSGINWPPALNRPDLSGVENVALHDLRFSVRVFGLRFRKEAHGYGTTGRVENATKLRNEVLERNPNAITLVDVGMRAAPREWFPDDSPVWLRDEQGHVFVEGGPRQPCHSWDT